MMNDSKTKKGVLSEDDSDSQILAIDNKLEC